MDSSTNVSLVFSNTFHQSRITMHNYLSQTDQPASFDKLQTKLTTIHFRGGYCLDFSQLKTFSLLSSQNIYFWRSFYEETEVFPSRNFKWANECVYTHKKKRCCCRIHFWVRWSNGFVVSKIGDLIIPTKKIMMTS